MVLFTPLERNIVRDVGLDRRLAFAHRNHRRDGSHDDRVDQFFFVLDLIDRQLDLSINPVLGIPPHMRTSVRTFVTFSCTVEPSDRTATGRSNAPSSIAVIVARTGPLARISSTLRYRSPANLLISILVSPEFPGAFVPSRPGQGDETSCRACGEEGCGATAASLATCAPCRIAIPILFGPDKASRFCTAHRFAGRHVAMLSAGGCGLQELGRGHEVHPRASGFHGAPSLAAGAAPATQSCWPSPRRSVLVIFFGERRPLGASSGDAGGFCGVKAFLTSARARLTLST